MRICGIFSYGLVAPEEQHGRFAECPLQVSIPDLVVTSFGSFPRRFVRTLHQSGIGDKIPDLRRAGYVMDLVEDRECEDRADSRD